MNKRKQNAVWNLLSAPLFPIIAFCILLTLDVSMTPTAKSLPSLVPAEEDASL
jgi:hypothetical protein